MTGLLAATRRLGPTSLGGWLILLGVSIAAIAVPLAFHPAFYDDFTLAKQSALLACTAIIMVGLALRGDILPTPRWLRILLACWLAALALSWLLGIDPRGSVLGVYQYREGLATQLCYLALLLGAMAIGRDGHRAVAFAAGAVGLGGVLLYTAIQTLGLDPISWWIDTSDRAIGTIGNANELAAFGVVGLAFCGAPVVGRWRLATVVAVCAASTFIVFAAQSRSGVIALALSLALFPVAAIVGRRPARWIANQVGLLSAGAVIGAVLALAAGSAGSTAARVEGGIRQSSVGESTRMELWRGTVATIKASPVVGFGPDGLYLAFPIHRPADLGGAFKSYDLPAQSSHNWFLDIAAEMGIPGLLVLIALLALCAWRSILTTRATQAEWVPFVWSALLGYLALTMLNPISLAAHTTFWLLLGLLVGTAEPTRLTLTNPHPRVKTIAFFAAAPAAAAALVLAVMLPLADLAANRGWEAYAAQDFHQAADDYRFAGRLLPLERRYARSEAAALLGAGSEGDRPALVAAESKYADIDEDFGFSAGEAIGLATARIGLGEPADRITSAVAEALALNPYGVSMQAYTAQLIQAAKARGALRYSDTDRWVYVEVTPATR